MKLAELQKALQAADPAAILVTPAVMTRVIQKECKLPTLLLNVPHRKTFVVDRHVLFRHVDQDELDLEPDRLLPATVILVSLPAPEQLAGAKREIIFLEYWRRLFHANVHIVLEKKSREGTLTLERVRRLIEEIGPTEFEEIRLVLSQDRYLLPPGTDEAVFFEFAAVFLELRYFAANLLPIYFPALLDLEKIERLLHQEVDAGGLFAQTRLAGAPDPVVRTDKRSDESNDYYWKLIRSAERAGQGGNNVRAAIVRTRAARVAPASLTLSTRIGAEEELQRLTQRLQSALELTPEEVQEWLKDLPPLLEKADQGNRPVEASLLFDLQKVCLDHEEDIYALDMVEWLLSVGHRPIKRPLPGQRLVRITKHLRSASQRLTMARLSDADRHHLARLLQSALKQSEERLRDRFRPILTDTLLDVGLQPRNPPERTAFHKMVEELLDRVTEYGFLTFGDLRDAVSRNQVKLADPADPQEFVRGDALLQLDRRLTTLMDGVYRPADFYLRWLERFTALNFGTETGRAITRYATLPFGGAYLFTLGLQLVLDIFHGPSLPTLIQWILVLFMGCFLFGLIHKEPFRRRLVQGAKVTGRIAKAVIIDLPVYIVHIPALRRLVTSLPFQLFYWYLFKPLVVCGLLWLWVPEVFTQWGAAAAIFLAVNFVLNSRAGRAVTEALLQAVVHFYELLREGLLPGLFRLLVGLFKQITDAVEYVMFTVDEWLRFRGGENPIAIGLRAVVGVFWYPVSYIARFYTVVLIEPGFNPIKAPVSILAAKIIYPLAAQFDFAGTLGSFLGHGIGPIPGYLIAAITVWFLPDAFGFLFWEMKENWNLYRANRRPTLRPVLVGPRGETVRQLLQPGFHSGTIPKLFAKLRQTEREALKTGIWRAARVCRQELEKVQNSLQLLVARELVPLVQQSPNWQGQSLRVGAVMLASIRIRIELTHNQFPAHSVWLEIEAHAGWLVAGISQSGWLDRLTAEQRQEVTAALAGLYKLAGIDLVREQVRANLPSAVNGFDLTADNLVLWLDHRNGQAIYYDLANINGQLKPRTPDGNYTGNGPVLDSTQLIFAQSPLTWDQWVESWRLDQAGKAPPNLFNGQVRLLPAEEAALPGTSA